jgi:hypothetical protein
MESNKKEKNGRFESIVDVLGNFCAFILGIVIIVFTTLELLFLIETDTHNVLSYIIYIGADAFCVLCLPSLGKTL